MTEYMQKLKQYAGIFGTGLLRQMAPDIAGGIINELFHKWKVDVPKIIADVERDRSIWEELDSDKRQHFVALAQKVGNLDFVTPDMVIRSIKKDFPAVASLFLSWPESYEWLTRQVDELKKEASNGTY